MPLYLLMLVPLVAMMVSDWKSRSVGIVWLALLFLLAGAGSVLVNGTEAALGHIGINLAVLFIVGSVLYVYSLVRRKPLGEMGGMGDFLFFVALTPLAGPIDYVRGAVVMLVFSLLLWALLRKRCNLDTIPLVTFCGVPLLLFILYLAVI